MIKMNKMNKLTFTSDKLLDYLVRYKIVKV